MAYQSRLELVIDSRTAERRLRAFDRRLSEVERSGDRTARSVSNTNQQVARLRGLATAASGALVGLAGALSAREVIQYADAWTGAENKIRQVTTSSQELEEVQKRLVDLAKETRSGFSSTVDLYTRLRRATYSLGLSQEEVITLTGTINRSFALSGATAEEAYNAVTQLSQGLAAGALRGEEFNSVSEQAPGIMRAIAESLDMTKGELRDFAAEGGITAEIVVNALRGASETIENDFAGSIETFSQKMEIARTNMTEWVGESDTVGDAVDGLGSAVVMLTESLDEMAAVAKTAMPFLIGGTVLGGLSRLTALAQGLGQARILKNVYNDAAMAAAGADLAAAGMRGLDTSQRAAAEAARLHWAELGTLRKGMLLTQVAVTSLTGSLARLAAGVAAVATPVTATVAAVAAAATALYLVRDSTVEVGNTTATVGEWIQGTWLAVEQAMGETFGNAVDVVSSLLDDLAKNFQWTYEWIHFAWSTTSQQIADLAKGTANAVIAYFDSLVDVAWIVGKGIIESFSGAFYRVLTLASAFWESLQSVFDGDFSFASFRVALGDELVQPMIGMAEEVSAAFQENLNRDYVGDAVVGVEKLGAAVAASTRQVQFMKSLGPLDKWLFYTNQGGGSGSSDRTPTPVSSTASAAESLASDLEKVRDMIEGPVEQATRKFADQMRMVDSLYAAGRLSLEDYNTALGVMREEFWDAVVASDSLLGALKDIQRQWEESGKTAQDAVNRQQAYASMMASEDPLERRKGALLNQREGLEASQQSFGDMVPGAPYFWDRAPENGFHRASEVAADRSMTQATGQLAKEETRIREQEAMNEGNLDLARHYAQKREQIEQGLNQRLRAMDEETARLRMSASQEMFGNLTSMTAAFAGEQSSLYKNMFATTKAFAIAESIINIQAAVAKAANMPFPDNLASMATVVGETASIVGNIQAVSMATSGGGGGEGQSSGGYSGMYDQGGRIPSDGWGIVGEHGPEIVEGPAKVTSRKETARQLKDGGDTYFSPQINVTLERSESDQGDGEEMGRQVAKAVEVKVLGIMHREMRSNGVLDRWKRGR
ncbi:MAG: tape measure protein [Gammaproteobacteria bacterium]|nr:tape measure protein [Gammaproteobacteria bacterium]